MKKQTIGREYNFPDADLYAQCKERLQYIKRDAKEFESYAYDGLKTEHFEHLCKQFAIS